MGEAPGRHQYPRGNGRRFALGGRRHGQRHAGAEGQHDGDLPRCRARGLRTVVGGPISSCMSDCRFTPTSGRGRSGRIVAGLAADLERGAAKPLYRPPNCPV